MLLAFAGALDFIKEVGAVATMTVMCSHPTARASRI
jgi:hypothetical protein